MTAGRCKSSYWSKSTGNPRSGGQWRGGEELGRAWRPEAHPEAKEAPLPDLPADRASSQRASHLPSPLPL